MIPAGSLFEAKKLEAMLLLPPQQQKPIFC
jgi:hypothetical protein